VAPHRHRHAELPAADRQSQWWLELLLKLPRGRSADGLLRRPSKAPFLAL
jgi:hypothetical protein